MNVWIRPVMGKVFETRIVGQREGICSCKDLYSKSNVKFTLEQASPEGE
jgi:hypothetical protein